MANGTIEWRIDQDAESRPESGIVASERLQYRDGIEDRGRNQNRQMGSPTSTSWNARRISVRMAPS